MHWLYFLLLLVVIKIRHYEESHQTDVQKRLMLKTYCCMSLKLFHYNKKISGVFYNSKY